MAKTCGDCRLTESASETHVWCYGAPPTVIGVTQNAAGGNDVASARPLLPKGARECGAFVQKPKTRK